MAYFFFAVATTESHGQVGTVCSCPDTDDVVVRLNVCYQGQECMVDVTLCNQKFSPGSTTVTCATANNAVDMYTVIKKICLVDSGCTFACDFQGIVAAILCELNPIGGDVFGVKNVIPTCGSFPYQFCWVVAVPRCMKLDPLGCAVACDNIPDCCIKHYRYCKDPSTGSYIVTLFQDCSTGTAECPANNCQCGRACITWDPAHCPTCN